MENGLFKMLVGGILLILITSCTTSRTLTPFSQRMYEEYNWSKEELKRIQFYLSDDIVLRRSIGDNSTTIKDGKIKMLDGNRVEEVIIRKGTPGVFVFSPKEQRLGISFDDDDSYLMFGPNPKQSERYVLLAKDWSRDRGIVTYRGESFETAANSAFATLMIDMDRAVKTTYRKEVAGGRRINE